MVNSFQLSRVGFSEKQEVQTEREITQMGNDQVAKPTTKYANSSQGYIEESISMRKEKIYIYIYIYIFIYI